MKRHENLRHIQQSLLKDMLTSEPTALPWKVLVMDQFTQRLVSPVLRVADLRELGVTLHLQLHAKRERIPDVPAVYFCEPTPANIDRIVEDVNQGVYTAFRLHFSTTLPRPMMERLANMTSKHSTRIERVVDEYQAFECIESRLFTVPLCTATSGGGGGNGEVFKLLMSTNVGDDEVQSALERQATGLLSVCVAVGGTPPLLAMARGGAAETVGGLLHGKLRDLMASIKQKTLGPSAFGDDLGLQRPLIIILDRSNDLATPMRHSASYAALVQDVYGMRHNRCVIRDGGDGTTTDSPVVFSVDPRDPIWTNHADSPFPEAADAVDAAVRQYKADYDAVQHKHHGGVGNNSTFATSSDLQMAVQLLPELTERKRQIDAHLHMCQSLLAVIKARRLGDLFAVEQRLDRQAVLHFLTTSDGDSSSISSLDKCRLYTLFMLSSAGYDDDDDAFEADCRRFMDGLPGDLKAKMARLREHVKLHRACSSLPASPPPVLSSSSLSPHQALPVASDGLLSGLASGVRSLMQTGGGLLYNAGNNTDLPLVKQCRMIIDSITTGANASHAADYTLLDPSHNNNNSNSGTGGTSQSAFNHVVVFVVGGVARVEYAAMQQMLQQQRKHQQVSIGGSAVVSAQDILDAF